MAKKTKKGLETEHREVSVPSIYSNTFGIGSTDTEVAINFGLSTPSYFKPHDDEDVPVARIFLSWEVAESLAETLRDVCEKHKKPQKPKRKSKTKGEGGSGR
ncbi:MAG: DUF3467 domain-containing protein [Dehalococcoidia bacterium]|nr:MAG: DUF3467 domain-containing protein [Dehalococcoidia bacterium]